VKGPYPRCGMSVRDNGLMVWGSGRMSSVFRGECLVRLLRLDEAKKFRREGRLFGKKDRTGPTLRTLPTSWSKPVQ
jgi:hypothetical protein